MTDNAEVAVSRHAGAARTLEGGGAAQQELRHRAGGLPHHERGVALRVAVLPAHAGDAQRQPRRQLLHRLLCAAWDMNCRQEYISSCQDALLPT